MAPPPANSSSPWRACACPRASHGAPPRRLGRSSRCRTDGGRRGQVVPIQAFLAASGYHDLPVRCACFLGGAGAHRRKLRAARRRVVRGERPPSGLARAQSVRAIQIDPDHTRPIQRTGEAKGWTVFQLPSTPDAHPQSPAPAFLAVRSSRMRPEAPVPVPHAQRPDLHVPARSSPVGVPVACAGEPLPAGAMPPGVRVVARDARARRRRRRLASTGGRLSSTRSPE